MTGPLANGRTERAMVGRTAWTRTGRVVARVLAVLLVLGAVAWVDGRLPTEETQLRPFVTEGAASEVVEGRAFRAVVNQVVGGRTLTGTGAAHASDGVWLDITVRTEAISRPATISWAAIRGRDGAIYPATQLIIQPLVSGSIEPGIPLLGHVYVEVPAADLAGSSLQLSTEAYDRRLDSVLQIDLGLDAAAARRFTGTADVALTRTRVVG